jgi:serine/threonine protein kinase
MQKTPKLKELVDTEIRVLKTCKNPNVIKFIDSFYSARSVFIAMEYCNGGDL